MFWFYLSVFSYEAGIINCIHVLDKVKSQTIMSLSISMCIFNCIEYGEKVDRGDQSEHLIEWSIKGISLIWGITMYQGHV